MSRVQTTYYGADPTTQFQWATAGSDQFSRERDLYFLAQAVEYHDHSNTRGLPAARVADGSLTAAAYAALSVGTAALGNLAVTSAKLGAGAVTHDKLASPLAQVTNDVAGSVKIADTTGAFTSFWFVGATGIAQFGVGSTQRILITPAGKVSVGPGNTAITPALLTVQQTGGTKEDGFRVVHGSNDAHRIDFYNDGSLQGHILTPTTDLILSQAAAGLYPGVNNTHILGHSSLYWNQLYCTNIAVPGVSSLGSVTATSAAITALTYSTLSGGAITCTTINTQGSTITAGALNVLSILCTTINTQGSGISSGTITCTGITCTSLNSSGGAIVVGAITSTTINCTNITCGIINTQGFGITSGTINCTGITCTSLNSAGGSITVGAISSGAITCTTLSALTTSVNGTLTLLNNNSMVPGSDATGFLGINGQAFSAVYAYNGFKSGGGSWSVLSDSRTKMQSKFQPFKEGLAEVLALQPEWFQYNGYYGTAGAKGQRFVGLRAEHAQEVAPHLVGTIKSRKTRRAAEEDILTVDPSNIPYMLVNAVKDLQAQIDELKAQLKDRRN